MNQYLYSYNFSYIFNSRDIEFIWEQLKVAIFNAINMFVPKVPNRNANQPRWFTPIIRHKVKCLHTLRRRYEKHPMQLNKSKVNKTAIELQLAMTEAKSDYKSNLILKFAHTHHNKIYQYISNIRDRTIFLLRCSIITNTPVLTKRKPNYLTTTFTQYFQLTLLLQSMSLQCLQVLVHYMTLKSMNLKYSLYLCSSLNGNKAPGIDHISPREYRHCALPLLKQICHLFAVSLSSGSIPS